MKLFVKFLVQPHWLIVLVAILPTQGCMTTSPEPVLEPEPEMAKPSLSEPSGEPISLMGDWCRVKKRLVTQYTVKPGKLYIRSGRSGRRYEADLSCDDAFTECEAKTIRGWESPVTEILRLDGENMNLTRIWGGAWKDKTYNFTFTRCPKW